MYQAVNRKKRLQWTTPLVLIVITLVACRRSPSAPVSTQNGNETVQVHYPGPSRSPDNVVVYFPGQKLLFGGCMIIGMGQVGNTSDADLAEWPESVRDLARFDSAMLVPGHGDRLDPGLVEHTLDLLADFQQ